MNLQDKNSLKGLLHALENCGSHAGRSRDWGPNQTGLVFPHLVNNEIPEG